MVHLLKNVMNCNNQLMRIRYCECVISAFTRGDRGFCEQTVCAGLVELSVLQSTVRIYN